MDCGLKEVEISVLYLCYFFSKQVTANRNQNMSGDLHYLQKNFLHLYYAILHITFQSTYKMNGDDITRCKLAGKTTINGRHI